MCWALLRPNHATGVGEPSTSFSLDERTRPGRKPVSVARLSGMKEKAPPNQDGTIREIAEAVRDRGGRALLVGGSVRDRLLERTPRDIDMEVLGLDLSELESILQRFGRTHRVGRDFQILKLAELDVDFSVAERPDLDFEEAARRRDLTINSMAMDPLRNELLDPHSGRFDLEAGLLRATDRERFGEDPLRALRVMRMAAELEMSIDPELMDLCREQDLESVASERVFSEFSRLLEKTRSPSVGLAFLEESGLLRFFPELDCLRGVPQDPEWHPEGDVWTHTLLSVDQAANMRQANEEDRPLMWAALCHDLGKPERTRVESGRVRSLGHDVEGSEQSQQLLGRLQAPSLLIEQVAVLVRHHLAPALYVAQEAGPKGYRRLARRLANGHVSLHLLERLARADHFGRTTKDARTRSFPAGSEFLEKAKAFSVDKGPLPDAVQGRDLIARGLHPGRKFGEILDRCRAIQDESGESDPEIILDQVLPLDSPGS